MSADLLNDGTVKRLALSVFIAALLAVLPGSAQGAPAPKQLGEVASAVTAFGNCPCTSVQFGDIGTANNSYALPYAGVITKSGFYVGDEINAADWVQMRSFTHSGTNRVTVAGDGAKHMLQGSTPKSIARFYERLPVNALGVLGARYSITSGFIEATPTYFNSPNTVDEVLGTTTSLAAGDSIEATPAKKLRVNVEAVLEPDEDHDAYGDVSQDLCPESPIGGGPCSGTLFGSNLQEAHGTGGGAAFEPLLVQKTIDGASTALPFDGVVVRWRVLSSNNDDFRIRVVSPDGSGVKVLSSSPVESVSVTPSPPIGKITSFATRLPIPAGAYVGLASPTKSLAPFALHASGASLTEFHDAPDGSTISGPGTVRPFEVAYDADVEPDVDHDGYGDITQDSCPGDASVHSGACPLAARPVSRTFPTITDLKVVPRRFRVKRGGAVAAKKNPPAGTKFKLNLSEAATVAFSIEVKPPCKPLKGAAAKCLPPAVIHTFRRNLGAGPSAIPYSGRYRKGRRIRTLDPGAYRLTASVIGANGRRVTSKQAIFAVVS
jgi:hypothetical protein